MDKIQTAGRATRSSSSSSSSTRRPTRKRRPSPKALASSAAAETLAVAKSDRESALLKRKKGRPLKNAMQPPKFRKAQKPPKAANNQKRNRYPPLRGCPSLELRLAFAPLLRRAATFAFGNRLRRFPVAIPRDLLLNPYRVCYYPSGHRSIRAFGYLYALLWWARHRCTSSPTQVTRLLEHIFNFLAIFDQPLLLAPKGDVPPKVLAGWLPPTPSQLPTPHAAPVPCCRAVLTALYDESNVMVVGTYYGVFPSGYVRPVFDQRMRATRCRLCSGRVAKIPAFAAQLLFAATQNVRGGVHCDVAFITKAAAFLRLFHLSFVAAFPAADPDSATGPDPLQFQLVASNQQRHLDPATLAGSGKPSLIVTGPSVKLKIDLQSSPLSTGPLLFDPSTTSTRPPWAINWLGSSSASLASPLGSPRSSSSSFGGPPRANRPRANSLDWDTGADPQEDVFLSADRPASALFPLGLQELMAAD
jgi:hypothetical protein